MADEEHVALLERGIGVWNRWREKNPDFKQNLSNANLCMAILRDANLRISL
jgi:hypothetical protein